MRCMLLLRTGIIPFSLRLKEEMNGHRAPFMDLQAVSLILSK